ncbi:hypothetical protein GCK32_014146 [Trichostrongylus colubriformis]|uniref:Uncharacterized protein n=1 Tax=Trichostrongylus colubriformis TaxID=6319 RepID=A0AAN8IJT7_TRICO
MCHGHSQRCWLVYVRAFHMSMDHRNPFVAITMERAHHNSFSSFVRLVPPKGNLNFSDSIGCINIHSWSIDRTSFLPEVNVTAVEIDELVVKIGFKWFGVKDSKYHHTVVQDGVSYLKESAVQGRKFDLIILDACTEFGCPAKQFQNMEIIKTFKKLLTWTGSLVIDIIPLPMSPEKALWLKNLQTVLPTCSVIKHRLKIFMIVVCVPYRTRRDSRTRALNNTLAEIASRLKLKDALHDFYVTSLSAAE